MATHGTLTAFDPGKENWTSYVLRMKFYFDANGVTDAGKKKSILLTACGASTFTKVSSLFTTERLDEIGYDDLVAEAKKFYDPKPSVIVSRFQFNSRMRAPGESIASYVAALRKLAEHCSYGDRLNEMIRDRLVCGVNHDTIQTRLLAEKDLTYEKALEIAQAVEAAETNSKILKNGSSNSTVLFSTSDTTGAGRLKKPPTSKTTTPTCYRCGGPHLAPVCKFKEVTCHFCRKKGHLAKVCRSKSDKPTKHVPNNPPSNTSHYVQDDQAEPEQPETNPTYSLFTVRTNSSGPIVQEVFLNNIPVKMELDTGASLTILSAATYRNISEQTEVSPLQDSTVHLRTYTGEDIKVLGVTSVNVRYGNQQVVLTIHVVEGDGPDLIGRDWLSHFNITFDVIDQVEQPPTLQKILDNHAAVFDGTLGCMKDVEVTLQVKTEVKPKFLRPRKVPYILKQKVEEELDRLSNLGIIAPVKTSKWAAPIVPVLKRNGSLRICGDFKTTFNQVSDIESYPLPRVEELFTNLSGGKFFSKLDMSNAYLQLPLADSSKEFLTINTHKGLYQFNRLPFGVNSAPAIFQRSIETLLRGLPGISVYLDDILVTGKTLDEHLKNLQQVLGKLEEAGLKLNKEKCSFLLKQIEYLGHVIDAQGLHPSEEKIKAIKAAPSPKNITELRSFLGIINYYSKFLPTLSAQLAPLYSLLRKHTKWSWGKEQEVAFTSAKQALQADSLLVHFDPAKPLLLACDASQYGIGAVLSHLMDDGRERPIAFTSRTLNPAEKKYSQLEKEALAIIFAVKKFHNYIYGKHFTIQSDHQPLSFLFSELKGIPAMASSRIQRWALTLAAYQYSIKYKAGKSLNNADALSRLPQADTSSDNGLPGDIIQLINHLSTTVISCSHIRKWTNRDPVLSKLKQYILQGFPTTKLDDELTPYKSKAQELSVIDGCILWGVRVVVPPQGRQAVLNELHDSHPGCSKMKSLARSYVWWPKMDSDIEQTVQKCQVCQESRPSPPTAPLHPWEWPSEPWSRLHLDFAGPFLGYNYLVLVDAHTKWMDVQVMSSTTSAKTIEKLREIFSTHGLPLKIVTDNGSAFTSQEFRKFMEQNGIRHITSAPYHPSTNGLAERAVQTFKRAIERLSDLPIQERLSKFLFTYRLTPHTTTGIAPAELLMGRRPRAALDNLRPDVSQKVEHKQAKQKLSHDSNAPLRTFQIGDAVFAENFTGKSPKWISGVIAEVTGPLSYTVKFSDGTTVRRHVDSIRKRTCPDSSDKSSTVDPLAFPYPCVPNPTPAAPPPERLHDPPPNPTPRRSTRVRHPPERFGL